jgi:uncharacterized protein YbjT (DUF2867 family)
MNKPLSVVMMGATGAVGTEVVKTLKSFNALEKLTLLGRRIQGDHNHAAIKQHVIDVMDVGSYAQYLAGHRIAICTLGVGEPSKVSKEELVKTDKTAVLLFAKACKEVGITHFQLLCSVGANSRSKSFYLRVKGELEDELKALGFERLSLFEPSVILTPTNRYGVTQAITLAVTPLLNPLLLGPLRKFRGIRIENLGAAIAHNVTNHVAGVEHLQFDAIMALSGKKGQWKD